VVNTHDREETTKDASEKELIVSIAPETAPTIAFHASSSPDEIPFIKYRTDDHGCTNHTWARKEAETRDEV
jgi:hypothetical protein